MARSPANARRPKPPRIPRPRARRWLAGIDGIAHLTSNHPMALHRAACGVDVPGERWAYPAATYCPICLVEAEALMEHR